MAVAAVVFDVGETLVDETRTWEAVADECGVPRFTLMALVGATIANGEPHTRALDRLGITPPRGVFFLDQWYPDALPCLTRLREHGLTVGAIGNMAVEHEELLRPHVAFVSSSERIGVEKPSSGFFARVAELAAAEPARIAYVGDRVDNDVAPALEAGMVAVHIRRGPWGYLQEPPPGAIAIRSLDELPEVSSLSFRVGIGVDAHAFADGVPLVLGGVRLDHPRGLAGHSDGDVLAHALVDAVLGAAGLGDIGSLFPSGDERFRGADSLELLREAYRQVREAGWTLVNADCVLVGEEPRIAASRDELRVRLGEALGGGEVNVRATTTDRLGFTGRGEGLAAYAVALLERA